MGDEQLLMAGLDVSPGFVHADDEFLAVILHLFLGIGEGELLLLDGMRATPPATDGYLDGCKDHRIGVLAKPVVVAVAGTDSHRGQVLAYLQLMLQAMTLDILLQEAVLGCSGEGCLMVLKQGDGNLRDTLRSR